MSKRIGAFFVLAILPFILTGCSTIGDKSTSLSIIYSLTSLCSFLILLLYFKWVQKKDFWFILLFISVFIVNIGYLLISISDSITFALHANRLSYFGSVFLPLSMLMIILTVSKMNFPKYLSHILFTISLLMFIIAATPGYSTIYYKEVYLETINGATVLEKVYGPLHPLYLAFLVVYFIVMIFVVIKATKNKRMQTSLHASFLLASVFVNLCVWLFGQTVHVHFEFLSISYIISELFLLGLNLLIQENDKELENAKQTIIIQSNNEEYTSQQIDAFKSGLETLTPTEFKIYQLYIEGKSTKDVLSILGIKENTLKYHNKNLYSKLSVNNRKELITLAKLVKNI